MSGVHKLNLQPRNFICSNRLYFILLGTFLLVISPCPVSCKVEASSPDPGCPAKSGPREKREIPEFFPIQERFNKDNLNFYLYTTKKSGENGSFKRTPIFSTEDFLGEGFHIKILIHGFMSSCESFEQDVIPEYLKEYANVHVICLDWSHLANPQEGLSAYAPTISHLPDVAKATTEFLGILDKAGLVEDFSDIHIVGFSLGAHLAGMIGAKAQEALGKKIGRITGLDPAGPEFDVIDSNEIKLDRDDAEFVDITHTSHGRLGTSKDLGHADFYMNDGKHQPRCQHEQDSVARIAESVTGYCSHRSAIVYFAESIKSRVIHGCRCKSFKKLRKGKCKCDDDDSKVVFGEHCTKDARGKFFVIL